MPMKRIFILFTAFIALAGTVYGSQPVEGDWQVNGGGATLRFEPSRGDEGRLNIVWLDGPDLAIEPGTIIGSAIVTSQPGVYDCAVDTDPRGKGDRRHYARFVVKLDADTGDSFTFAPYEQGVRFQLQALLPYWWRRPVKQVDTRPAGLDGARRVGAPKQFVEL